jgi:hypothetical protein
MINDEEKGGTDEKADKRAHERLWRGPRYTSSGMQDQLR